MGKAKHLVFIAPLLFVAALMLFAYKNVLFSDSKNQSADVSGESLPLFRHFSEKLKDKPKTLVALWATWCAPCVKELPILEAALPEFEKKGIGLLLVNYDPEADTRKKTEETVNAWMKSLKLNMPTEYDFESKILNEYKIYSLPFALLVDQNQKVLETFSGEQDWASWIRSQ